MGAGRVTMKLSLLNASLILMAAHGMGQHAHQTDSISQTGQSQFAAIAQIVTELWEAPDTE